MKTARLVLSLFVLSTVCGLVSPNAKADQWDKKTIVTFSGPVDVSGHRLDAGTYVFKLADSQADRHIVQIFNEDESHIIATILAIPNWRVTPTGKTAIKFSERAGEVSTMQRDLPVGGIPVKEWFYPGDNFGQEFIVKPAAVVAENTTVTEPVAATTAAPAVTQEEAVASAPEVKAAEPVPVVETAQVQQPVEPAPVQSAAAPQELPHTASTLPLIGLIGLASLSIAISLRLFSKLSA